MVALRRGSTLHNLSSLKLHFLQAMRSLCGDGKHTFIIIEEHTIYQTWQKRMRGLEGKPSWTLSLSHAVSLLNWWAFQLTSNCSGQEATSLHGLFTVQHPFWSCPSHPLQSNSELFVNTIAERRCVRVTKSFQNGIDVFISWDIKNRAMKLSSAYSMLNSFK